MTSFRKAQSQGNGLLPLYVRYLQSSHMAEWFVQQTSEVLGPLGPAELLSLVRSGVVTQNTKIRKRDSEWLNASEVGGLFEAAMRPTIENRCPECDALLDSVPCTCTKCGRRVHTPRTRIIENTICKNHVPDENT